MSANDVRRDGSGCCRWFVLVLVLVLLVMQQVQVVVPVGDGISAGFGSINSV